MDESEIEQVVQEMLGAYESENYYLMIADIIILCCFLASIIFTVISKVQTIKLKRQNYELQKKQAQNESDKATLEINLRKEYSDSMKTLSDNVLNKVEANKKEAAAATAARTESVTKTLDKATKTIDDILGK